MIVGVVQDHSMEKYEQKFSWWREFVRRTGFADPLLRNMTEDDLTVFVCGFAAWARSDGRWGGDTVIQSLSAVRHIFRCHFRPYTVFKCDTIAALRKKLRFTDMLDEARANKDDRLPFTADMMQYSKQRAVDSDDLLTIMTITGIMTSQMVFLRISEYGQKPNKTHPDHRMRATNVVIFVKGFGTGLTTEQFCTYVDTQQGDADQLVEAICITVPGSKTDRKRAGFTFAFEAKDFDMEDKTNSISMWVRWILLTRPKRGDLFFKMTTKDGEVLELSADLVTIELRLVAAIHGVPEDQLHRVSPHSVRIGMSTHCHNIGLSDPMILQMGRWSKRSKSAPIYRRMGAGVCTAIARAVARENISKGQTSTNLLRTAITPKGSRDQYKKKRK